MYKRQRYDFIENVCRDTVVKCRESRERERSEAIDRVVTNKYLALPLFFCIMLGIFYLTFEVIGAFLSDLLAAGIDALSAAVDAGLTSYGLNSVVHSLVIDGIFAGVGSVLSFLPIIVVLFFFLSILEDTGYMARVAFFMDQLLRKMCIRDRSAPIPRAGLQAVWSTPPARCLWTPPAGRFPPVSPPRQREAARMWPLF